MGAWVARGVLVAAAGRVVAVLVGTGFVALGRAVAPPRGVRSVGVAAGVQASRARTSIIDTKKMRFTGISYCKF